MIDSSIQRPPGFTELSKSDQIRYLQALWDLVSESPEEVPVPESHLELAEKRLRDHRENLSTAESAFEMLDRLANKSK
jgi:hypothetical protein